MENARVRVDEDGALIQEENPIASSSYSSEGDLTSEQAQERIDRLGINEEELVRVITNEADKHQLEMGKYEEEKMAEDKLEIAVTNINFNAALDVATAVLLNDPRNVQPNEEYRDTLKNMSKNQYFRAFANSYQRKLNKVLDRHYNEAGNDQKRSSPMKAKGKAEKTPKYGDMVLGHLSSKQVYRKHAPQLFHGVVDSKNKELAEGIKTYAKVPLPPDLKQRKDVLEQLKLHRKKFGSLDAKRNSDMYTIIEKKEPDLKAKLGSPKK